MLELPRMDGTNFALLMATIVMLSVGQILFKLAAVSIDFGDVRTLLSARLISALAIYGLATVMWMLVLSRMPLSAAFPFYSLTFLIVPLLGAWWLGEPLRLNSVVGGGIIMIGVAVSAAKWN